MKNTKTQYLRLLRLHPVKIGKAVGFTKLTDLHNEWMVDMINGHGDETLQAHRGSYKTTSVSIALAIIIIIYPNDKTVFIRKTDGNVREIIKQTATILKTEIMGLIVRELYDVDLVVEDTAYTINTNLPDDPRGTPQLIGRGVGGSITGQHYDRVFTDDIVTVEDRVSEAERKKTIDFYQELQNIKNRDGRIYNTGTPWHKEDAFTIMPNPKKYDVSMTGLISEAEQEELKSKMLPSLYAANYRLIHIAPEDVVFTNPTLHGDPSVLIGCNYCHIDAAYNGSDSTAFSIVKKKGGKYYVFGKLWRKHVDDCQNEIIFYRKSFKAGRIYCEDNGDKGYLAKELRKKGETVTTYTESMNKLLKIATFLKFNWKDVVFVEGTDQSYIDQITDWTEVAEHDDAADDLACQIRLQFNKSDTEYQSIFGK